MAIGGEIRWPSAGRNQWPLTFGRPLRWSSVQPALHYARLSAGLRCGCCAAAGASSSGLVNRTTPHEEGPQIPALRRRREDQDRAGQRGGRGDRFLTTGGRPAPGGRLAALHHAVFLAWWVQPRRRSRSLVVANPAVRKVGRAGRVALWPHPPRAGPPRAGSASAPPVPARAAHTCRPTSTPRPRRRPSHTRSSWWRIVELNQAAASLTRAAYGLASSTTERRPTRPHWPTWSATSPPAPRPWPPARWSTRWSCWTWSRASATTLRAASCRPCQRRAGGALRLARRSPEVQ